MMQQNPPPEWWNSQIEQWVGLAVALASATLGVFNHRGNAHTRAVVEKATRHGFRWAFEESSEDFPTVTAEEVPVLRLSTLSVDPDSDGLDVHLRLTLRAESRQARHD